MEPGDDVVAFARRPAFDLEQALARPGPVIFLEAPRHLGNLGAAIRVAAAADAAAVLTSGTSDPWHPHAIRGAAGLQFALPVARVDDVPRGRELVAIDPEGEERAGAESTRSSRSAASATGSARRSKHAPTPASGSRCAQASPA